MSANTDASTKFTPKLNTFFCEESVEVVDRQTQLFYIWTSIYKSKRHRRAIWYGWRRVRGTYTLQSMQFMLLLNPCPKTCVFRKCHTLYWHWGVTPQSTFFQYCFCYVPRVTGLLPHSRVFSFSYFPYYSAAHRDAKIDVSKLCLKTAPDLQF